MTSCSVVRGSWLADHAPRTTNSDLCRSPAAPGLGHLTFVNPHLHADGAVRGVRGGLAVVDIRFERVQRQPPILVPLRARDLCAIEPSSHANLDALCAEPERALHRFLHGPTEGDAPLQLRGDVLRHQLGIELRTLNLLDIDVDLTVDQLLQLITQLVHFGALAADDDSRTRGVDVDAHLVRRALDVDLGYASVREALLEILAKLQIAMKRLRVVLSCEPARVPGFVESEPKSVRVDLLTQACLRYFA